MFVAVFYWVLTVFFLILYITMTYTRIPQVPWTTVGLCFNGSAFVLYLSAAIVDASSVSPERDSHNFNSWAASSVSEPLTPRSPPSAQALWGRGRAKPSRRDKERTWVLFVCLRGMCVDALSVLRKPPQRVPSRASEETMSVEGGPSPF
uniref:CKLF like MARVEL transmembrane domain containing 8 n=1 Tax=Molossus molossus TaxID=27622 RepID=A0A7J8DAK7_MOLMO|nr:CKLF like MARVEL transmembrane domain containing 8 [Molossus molossus]